jgi:serine protease
MRAAWLVPLAASAFTACAGLEPEPERDPSPAGGSAALRTALAPVTPDAVPDQVIAKLAAPVQAGDQLVIAGQRLTAIRPLADGAWLLAIEPADTAVEARAVAGRTSAAIAALAGDAGVVYAHANGVLQFSFVPSDPLYPQQWHYPQIGLPSAWDVTRGLASVRIAAFDSGSTGHPDLAGRFAGGRDFVDGLGPTDIGPWHHGTHVAGILGAATSVTGGIGGAGICSGCSLIPIRVSDANGSTTFDILEQAFSWAAGDLAGGVRQADVVNLSMNAPDVSDCAQAYPDLAAAIQHATDRGVVVVNSAGNFATQPTIPSSCPTVISVAATQTNKTLAVYSDRGARIDLAAPGGAGVAPPAGQAGGGYGPGIGCLADSTLQTETDSVVSTWARYPIVNLTSADYCYRYLSGTSMAAPHVAGTVGLMLSAKPAGVTLTPAQIQRILTLTAQPIACAAAHTCGAGLLDAGRAVAAAHVGRAPVLVASPTAIAFGTVVIGASAPASATVTNTGLGTLTIGGAPSLQIIGASAAQFELGLAGCSGQSCAQSLAITEGASGAIAVRCRPTVTGAFTAALVIHSDSIAGDASVALSCIGTLPPAPQLVLGGGSFGFNNTHVGVPAIPKPLTIGNTGGSSLTFSTSTPPPFTATCSSGCTCSGTTCSGSVAPGGSAVLSVGFTPTAVGFANAVLVITSNDPAHPSTGLALSGFGGTGVGVLTPATLALGDTPVGGAATGTLWLSNTGTYSLTVSALDLSDAADFAFGFTSGPCAGTAHCATALILGGKLAIPVTCRPAAEGGHSAQVTATTDGAVAAVTATVTCNGVAPHVALGPSSLDLGEVRVGRAASGELILSNTTGAQGTQLAFSVSQGSSQYSLSCASGCTCSDDICTGSIGATPAHVMVTFAPTAVGFQAANVTFTTSDATVPTAIAVVTGVGIGPVFHRIAPADGELALVATPGGTSNPGVVQIGNTGNADLHITAASFTGDSLAVMALALDATLPLTLAPGTMVELGVTCTPTWRLGARTAQLGFAADAGTTTVIDISCKVVKPTTVAR